jgi:hypothetical protein
MTKMTDTPHITSLFNERLKRDMPAIQQMFADYFDATGQVQDWEDAAQAHWDAIVARVTTLVTQALHDDPTAVEKLRTWSLESGFPIDLHADKVKQRLPGIIALSIVNAMAAFADGLDAAIYSDSEEPPASPGPKAV